MNSQAGPQVAWGEVTVDCLDPERVATFWGELLGRPAERQPDGWFRIASTVPGGPLINFQPVPEPKVGKTRVHLDLWVDDLETAMARAERLGGRRLGEVGTYAEGRVVVMADPESTEFCLVALPAE